MPDNAATAPELTPVEAAKRAAAHRAVDNHVLPSTRVIGIGSGSTIVYAVDRIAELVRTGGLPALIACIPTSFQAKQLIVENGLPLSELNVQPIVDVAFDGADEVDAELNCIKGGGGCHLLEKLVAASARTFVLVADDRKDSPTGLGVRWTTGIPLEVIPAAYVPIQLKLQTQHSWASTLRMAVRKAGPVVTDSGNLIVDVRVDAEALRADARAVDQKLRAIPGVVETGLFCRMARWCYFGRADGDVEVRENRDAVSTSL